MRQGTIKIATKADSDTVFILVGCTELPSLLLARSGAWLIYINQGSSCVYTSIYYSHTPFLEFRKVSRLQISNSMVALVKLIPEAPRLLISFDQIPRAHMAKIRQNDNPYEKQHKITLND